MTNPAAARRGRAPSMPPDERRDALVRATLPLLREHGLAVSTRQIAEAAGVAEGTIFRVFDSKDQLVEAALSKAFEPGTFIGSVSAIDATLPLRERLVALVTVLQQRFTDIFGLMRAVGMVGPPDHLDDDHERDDWRHRILEQMVALIGDDAASLRLPVTTVLHVIRLLTFSASHLDIADNQLLTPEQIVDIILDGVLADPHKGAAAARKGKH